jgi:hypothetical protein
MVNSEIRGIADFFFAALRRFSCPPRTIGHEQRCRHERASHFRLHVGVSPRRYAKSDVTRSQTMCHSLGLNRTAAAALGAPER